MVKRIMLIFLLGISLMALLGTQADARVCVAYSGGKCLVWSGTVECEIAATGLGNCADNLWTLGCSATASNDWAVACGNPGSKTWTAPGINVFHFSGTLSGTLAVTPDMCDKNGNATVTVHNNVSQDLLVALVQAGACPNPNWIAIDAVPCDAIVLDQQFDANGCVVADATFHCVLPNCASLQWDVNLQTFERRQYDCDRTSYNVYKVPVCP